MRFFVAKNQIFFEIKLPLIMKERQWKKNQAKNSEIFEKNLLDPSDDSFVNISDRKFPKSTVKNWNDIERGQQVGYGHFGNVYKGFLRLTDYTR